MLPVNDQLYLILWVLSNWYTLSSENAFTSMIEKELANPMFSEIRDVLYASLDCTTDSIFMINGEKWQVRDIEQDIDKEEKLFELFNLKKNDV